MPNLHTYTAQEVMNMLYGSSTRTTFTEQQVANQQQGSSTSTSLPWQVILNRNLGLTDFFYTLQRALWHVLQTKLSLTGSDSQYTEQELLNMAYNGGLTISDVLGIASGGGGGSNAGLLLLMGAA